jgi:hypothetical protein
MTDLKSDWMTEFGFALFETPIGCCGIVWNERGIAGVQLPEADERAIRSRILRRFPGVSGAVPPADVQRVVDDIAALLNGEPRDLGYAKSIRPRCRIFTAAFTTWRGPFRRAPLVLRQDR